jgi:hypothetical protein
MMEIEPTEPDIILLKPSLDHEGAGLYPITTTSGNPLHLEVPATSYLGSPRPPQHLVDLGQPPTRSCDVAMSSLLA